MSTALSWMRLEVCDNLMILPLGQTSKIRKKRESLKKDIKEVEGN